MNIGRWLAMSRVGISSNGGTTTLQVLLLRANRPPDRQWDESRPILQLVSGAILASCRFRSNRHAVPLADRTRDVRTIATAEVLAANPETTPARYRDRAPRRRREAYLVAKSTPAGFEIVLGMPAWHAALADAGITVEQNWAAAATRK
jgi:hypothetical protein